MDRCAFTGEDEHGISKRDGQCCLSARDVVGLRFRQFRQSPWFHFSAVSVTVVGCLVVLLSSLVEVSRFDVFWFLGLADLNYRQLIVEAGLAGLFCCLSLIVRRMVVV